MSDIRCFTRQKFIRHDIGVTININKFKSWHHGKHTHEFIELAYMLGGESVQYVDGTEYSLRHGQLMFINPGQVHDFYTKDGTKIIDVLIDPEWICDSLINADNAFALLSLSDFSAFEDNIDKSVCRITFDRHERTVIESILGMMAQEQKNNFVNYSVTMHLLTELLFIHIFRKMSGIENNFIISPEFLQFIHDNCTQKLTLSELSKRCFYNPSYFSRMFREHYGLTLTEFIQNSRFERACALMADNTLTIDEIAVQSGFGSKRTLYKVFHEKTGLSPAEYRKKLTAE